MGYQPMRIACYYPEPLFIEHTPHGLVAHVTVKPLQGSRSDDTKGCVMIPRLFASMLLVLFPVLSRALSPQEAQALYQKVSPSLVVVQYTWDSEFGRQELVAQGLVIAEEGTVMTFGNLFPRAMPDDQMKDFKIILPGDEEREFEAVFLGRDERADLAFLKTREPQKWPAVKFEESPVKVREPVISIGLLPKDAGYKSFYTEAFVAAVLRGPVPYVMVSAEGVGTVASPVFNGEGKAIGWVPAQDGQRMLLDGEGAAPGGGGGRGRGGFGRGGPAPQQSDTVPNPARLFVPARDFLPSLSDLPEGEPLKLPWLGAVLTGLNRDVAEVYKLKGVPVAQVGEVIPDSAAAKAGLRVNDKILKLNGETLERGDEPAEVAQILVRKVRRMKVGDKLTLSVLRERNKPPTDVEVTLEEQPKGPSLAKRHYAEDLGLSVRELVFEDVYARRLPADTKGLLVAYVRQSSSAATAGLRNGDVVTELNSVAIKDLEQFKAQYKEFREQKPKDVVVLVVVREGNTQVIRMEPPQ